MNHQAILKVMPKVKLPRLAHLFTILTLILVTVGCARQPRPAQMTGFLGDYSPLKPDKQLGAEEIYTFRNSTISDLSKYDSIIVDPVSFWSGQGSDQISEKSAQFLVDQFYFYLLDEIGQDLRIVSIPGPNTLRLQVAITNPRDTDQTIHAFTSVGTPARIIAEVPELTAGRATAVEALGLEAKLSNALTGEVYYMVVDKRFGRKNLNTLKTQTLNTDEIIESWAQAARNRICILRNQESCSESSLG